MANIREYRSNDGKESFTKKDQKVYSDVEHLLKCIPQLEKICSVREKIGQGTFSKVYKAVAKKKTVKFDSVWAIKHIVPTAHPSRVLEEILCLKKFGGCENVIGAIHCMRNENHIALIMPFVQSDNFRDFVGKLKPRELCYYMQQLLIALRRVHSCNYIHRDIKPSNFLYSRSSDRCALIDFGLVQKIGTVGPLNVQTSSSDSIPKRSLEYSETNELHPAKRILTDNMQSQKPNSRKSPNKLQLESPPREPLDRGQTNGFLNGSVLDSPSKHTRAAETRNTNWQVPCQAPAMNGIKTPDAKLTSHSVAKHQQIIVNGCDSSLRNNKVTDLSRLSLHQVRTRSGRNELRMMKNICNCFGSSRVCMLCLQRSSQYAHRSGTPGFRSPEVLLKHPNQTYAVDIWSAGVILLCLLSGRYPFFQAVDDCSALAEISTLLGTQAIRKTAEKLKKTFLTSEEKPAPSLFIVCESLRHRSSQHCHACRKKSSCTCKKNPTNGTNSNGYWNLAYPREIYDLLSKLLDPNPYTRISADEALQHRVFSLL